MEKFTTEETDRLNILYADGFKGEITALDVRLISRFEYMKAFDDITAQMKNEEIKENAKARAAGTQSVFEQALTNMQELHARALANFDKLEKRERPKFEDAQKQEYKIETGSAHNGI